MKRTPVQDVPKPYWTLEERILLGRHLTKSMRRLVPDPSVYFLIYVAPERNFLTHPDTRLAELAWSVQGNWSVWIRETWNGVPIPYRLFVERAIEAVADRIPDEQFLDKAIKAAVAVQSGAEPWLPDHPRAPKEIHMRTKAIALGILRDDPPAAVASLFARDRIQARTAKLKEEDHLRKKIHRACSRGAMLTWTHQKPQAPGWYRYRGVDGKIHLLHLKRVDDGAFYEGQMKTAWPWDYFPGEWFGPIETPSSQTEEG